MKSTTTLAALLLLAAVGGCGEKEVPTAAGPDDLGRRIVEALAQVPVEPESRTWRKPHRPPGPLDLSRVAIHSGSVNHIGDPELEDAVGKYVEREFPGIMKECPKPGNCLPLSPEDLPPEGFLVFGQTPGDPPGQVSAIHYVFVRRGDEMVLDPPAWYSVEMERPEGGGWKVGKTTRRCCAG